MRQLLLCRERLTRLLTVLDREGGSCSVRDLYRSYGIREWEVEQAEQTGWVRISEHKRTVGRPSRVAAKLSETQSAKLPPWRYAIPKELSIRHHNFVFQMTCVGPRRNAFGFGLQTSHPPYPMSSMFAFTCFSSAARLASLRNSSAPKGQNTIARGNALGPASKHHPSPEWAAQPLFRPFRAR